MSLTHILQTRKLNTERKTKLFNIIQQGRGGTKVQTQTISCKGCKPQSWTLWVMLGKHLPALGLDFSTCK